MSPDTERTSNSVYQSKLLSLAYIAVYFSNQGCPRNLSAMMKKFYNMN